MSSGHPLDMKNTKGAPSGDGWVVTAWKCSCHPASTWSTYSTGENCEYSDRNIFSPLCYSDDERYGTYADLAAAHDLIPMAVNNDAALLVEMYKLKGWTTT